MSNHHLSLVRDAISEINKSSTGPRQKSRFGFCLSCCLKINNGKNDMTKNVQE